MRKREASQEELFYEFMEHKKKMVKEDGKSRYGKTYGCRLGALL